MKRSVMRAAVLFAAVSVGVQTVYADEVSVTVRSVVVRKSPTYLAPAAFEARYGDSFTKVGGESGWVQVRSGRGSGWVHESALVERTIDLTQLPASDAGGGSSSPDVVFAAKGIDAGGAGASHGMILPGDGFDVAAERALSGRGGAGDYQALDKALAALGKGHDLSSFAKQGRLLR